MKISREEALKIASISRLFLDQAQVEEVIHQLQDVLGYAQSVQELATDLDDQPSNRNTNVTREDVVHTFDVKKLLERAPEREENYFVVPRILDSK